MATVDVMYAYLAPVHIIAEVVQFHITVFGPWAVFVMLGHLNSSAVVFKHAAKYTALRLIDRESASLHFSHCLDHRNGVPQGI